MEKFGDAILGKDEKIFLESSCKIKETWYDHSQILGKIFKRERSVGEGKAAITNYRLLAYRNKGIFNKSPDLVLTQNITDVVSIAIIKSNKVRIVFVNQYESILEFKDKLAQKWEDTIMKILDEKNGNG